MNRRPVTSSNVAAVGWEAETLEIEYRSGHIYQFHEVPEEVYHTLIAAESVGKTLNSVKGDYTSTRIK